jgi:ELWxxDGT repeat protein
VSGTLYFAANDGTTGVELWKSEGTDALTVLVFDIYNGAPSSSPHELTNFNGTLFFAANDGTTGVELWKTNTTPNVPGSSSGGCFISTVIGEAQKAIYRVLSFIFLFVTLSGVGTFIMLRKKI